MPGIVLRHTAPVYNIEVDGEHVYEVTELGILVHNSGLWDCGKFLKLRKKFLDGTLTDAAEIAEYKELKKLISKNFRKFMSEEDLAKLERLKPGEAGEHLHHILPKLGVTDEVAKEIIEVQMVLWDRFGIDPFTSLEMFVWAGKKGVHGVEPTMKVVNALKEAFKIPKATRTTIADVLEDLGKKAQQAASSS